MKEPVDHVLRPRLPWRSDEGAITECGYDATKVKAISRDELRARFKEFGQQRTAILTCMTCVDTAGRWSDWETDPREAIGREIEWERRGRWSDDTHSRGRRLRFELVAIAELIGAHRAEFDATMTRLEGVADWQATKADRRNEKQRQRARGRSF